MMTSNVTLTGHNGDTVQAYVAIPAGQGPFPGVVMTHHAPGWDEFSREFVRRLADHGYMAIVPNLYERFGHGTPDEVATKARAEGGVADASVIGDAEAAMKWLRAQPQSNGKVGITGPCSGGRHAVLVASSVPGFDAVVDLWGGVVAAPDQLNEKRPVAVIDLTPQLNAPILGIFGNDDMGPSPAQVNQHEAALKEYGKTYQFHRYDGAGHGFFNYFSPMQFRTQQSMDGWGKLLAWFDEYLKA